MIEKLQKIKHTLRKDISQETIGNLEPMLEGITLTDMITANNVSILLNKEKKKFLDICSSIRLALGVFAQGLNALNHFVENNKNIGFTKMDSIIKFDGYKYFSRSQYDKRYLNTPYLTV